ncbi:hypothetical protein ACFWY6_23510 [Streptomyces sp. NPDC059037]|uniref:hypothetical protein n=1 Tax=Streptomyces sp. NPDC059037 TaxID=3346710 RepID=UPI0036CCA91A
MRNAPTIAQLRNIADRADRGQLAPAEVARLRQGIDRFSRRTNTNAAGWANKTRALRRRLTELHYPVQRGSIAACAECSGWNGRRCVGLVTQWPCPTLDAVDDLFPAKETA